MKTLMKKARLIGRASINRQIEATTLYSSILTTTALMTRNSHLGRTGRVEYTILKPCWSKRRRKITKLNLTTPRKRTSWTGISQLWVASSILRYLLTRMSTIGFHKKNWCELMLRRKKLGQTPLLKMLRKGFKRIEIIWMIDCLPPSQR